MHRSSGFRFCGVVISGGALLVLLPSLLMAQVGGVSPTNAVQGDLTADERLDQALSTLDRLEDSDGSQEDLDALEQVRQTAAGILAQDPLNIRADYVLGRVAFLYGRYREALPRIERYANNMVGQTDWKAWKLLGDIHLKSYPQLAELKYKKAAELMPDEPDILIGWASAHLKRSKGKEAVETARKAIQYARQPEPQYQEVLAEGLLLDKKYDEAIVAAKESVAMTEEEIRQAPGKLDLLVDLKSRYELLKRCYETAYGLYSERTEYVVGFAKTMQDAADLDRLMGYHNALSVLDSVESPGTDILFEKARLSRIVGKNDEAVELANEVLKAQPGHAGAMDILNQLGASPSEAPAPAASDQQVP